MMMKTSLTKVDELMHISFMQRVADGLMRSAPLF